jgi:phospholipid/cholesterol/gamma-HCH transport system substrate-binding protein
MMLRRLGWPLRVVVLAVVVGMVALALHLLQGPATYHVRLHTASGLRPGADVRVAGIRVGRVTSVQAERDQVDVAFTLSTSPSEDGITTRSRSEVKLLSLLGQRYLSLTTADGPSLGAGATIPISQALDTYPIERFWLESVPQVERLDLPVIERSIKAMTGALAVDPRRLRTSLQGITRVSRLVQTHSADLDALLAATHQVTALVLAQTRHLDTILDKGGKVLTTVYQRRALLSELLREAHRFVTGLTAVVRASAPQLTPALADLHSVLKVLDRHRRDIDATLRLAGPTMREFTSSAGDGPWLGVNAPYAIFPDNMICSLLPGSCR